MLRHLTAAGSRNRWLRDCRFVGSPRPDAVASSHPQALDVHCDAVGSMGRPEGVGRGGTGIAVSERGREPRRAAMDLFRTVSCNKVALRCHSSLPLLAQSL